MSYYRTCPYCGDNNDPCETCECQKVRIIPANKDKKKILIIGNTNKQAEGVKNK